MYFVCRVACMGISYGCANRVCVCISVTVTDEKRFEVNPEGVSQKPSWKASWRNMLRKVTGGSVSATRVYGYDRRLMPERVSALGAGSLSAVYG